MELALAVVTGCVIARLLWPATPLSRACSRRGSCSGTPLRGEKAPDDALARELGAMGLL
jgi:hypothetical protein